MKANRLKAGILSIAIISATVLSACDTKDEADELVPSITDTAITVSQQLPEVKTLSTISNYIGTVEADSTIYIIPKVNAEVLSKNYEVGDHVAGLSSACIRKRACKV